MARQRPRARRLRSRRGTLQPRTRSEHAAASESIVAHVDLDERELAQTPDRKPPGPGRPRRANTTRPAVDAPESADDAESSGPPPTDPI